MKHYNFSQQPHPLQEGWARFEAYGGYWDFDREHFPTPEVALGEWQRLWVCVSYQDRAIAFEDETAARFIEWTWAEGIVKPRR